MRGRDPPRSGARSPDHRHAPGRMVLRAGDAAVSLPGRGPDGVHERHGMNARLKRTPGIYVAGFMGAGKSTVGRHLAHRLGWNFFDTDHEIEAAEHVTIPELFSTRGEPEFRRI